MIISMQRNGEQSACPFSTLFRKAPNELRVDLNGRVLSRAAGWLLFVLAIASAQLHAQLSYDHTSFLNGTASDSTIWTRSYADLQTTPVGYLSQRVVLGTPGYPNVDSLKRYSGQVSDIAAYLTRGGQHVLVGHSLGSLVARGTYIDNSGIRPDVAAIVALTAPHQGTKLADNFVLLRNFLRDMQRRIDDAKTAIAIESAVLINLFSVFVPEHRTTGLGPSIVAFLLINTSGIGIDVSNLSQFSAAPAVADQSPDSAAIIHLNARYDDGAIPRANVYATIPFRNAALRLYESSRDRDADFPSLVRWRDKGQAAFSACKWFGYVTIIQWTLGRRCAYARKTLARLDDRWARYVNGWDAYGNTRYVPFDGVVANERSVYPSTNGLAFQGVAPLTNHLNVYKTRTGLDQAANGMVRVGMQPVGNPPPSFSVTINGQTDAQVGCPGEWLGGASGGAAPYTYSWTVNGAPYDTGGSEYLTYTPTETGTLSLQIAVTDANGSSGQASLNVSVTSGNCT